MASSIDAATAGAGGVITTSDASGVLQLKTAGTTAVTINSSQNVGIGTSSPSYKLHVSSAQGSLATQSTTITNSVYNAFINGGGTSYVGVDTSTGSIFGAGAYGFTIFNAANSPTTFVTNSTERMRINSSGQVLIGQTSAIYTEQFAVTNPTTAGWTASFTNTTASTSLGTIISGTASNLYALYFQTGYVAGSGGTLAGIVVCSGTTTTYGTTSDYRLKTNVQPMSGALEKVQALNPVTYDWIADNKPSQGFIAHELQAVVPECVVGEKDAVVENGKPKYQVVDTSFLVATLTAAIKEQQALITTLQAQVAALQAKVGV
jgi:hypothetical protein